LLLWKRGFYCLKGRPPGGGENPFAVFDQAPMAGRPRQGVFEKPGKLFERQRVLAGLLKNARAWPESG